MIVLVPVRVVRNSAAFVLYKRHTKVAFFNAKQKDVGIPGHAYDTPLFPYVELIYAIDVKETFLSRNGGIDGFRSLSVAEIFGPQHYH